MKTLKTFVNNYKILNDLKLEISKIPFRIDINQDEWANESSHWAFIISQKRVGKNDYKIKGFFSQGSAIKTRPTIEEILNSLVLDTIDLDNLSYNDWCDNFGFDNDSIKAENIYKGCKSEHEQMKKFFTQSQLDELYECESL